MTDQDLTEKSVASLGRLIPDIGLQRCIGCMDTKMQDQKMEDRNLQKNESLQMTG